MTAESSSMWDSIPSDIEPRLRRSLDAAIEKTAGPIRLFCRADDVAVPSTNFKQLVDLFLKHRMPLDLAVVPAWLTEPRWRSLRKLSRGETGLFSWHQHGWRHVNHELTGKKQEFGPARPRRILCEDLAKGRQRLENLMGGEFTPVFTPPWNRCDRNTLFLLAEQGFRAVSRNRKNFPISPSGFNDISVNVDLHTMKAASPAAAWERLLHDLETAVSTRLCGIMIHHQRMNRTAFDFLDLLLKEAKRRGRLNPLNFNQLTLHGKVS